MIVFYICSRIKPVHVTIYSTADNNDGIRNAAIYHETTVFVENQQARHRQDISKGDGRSGGTYNKSIKDTIADHQIILINIRCKPFDT